MSRKNATHTQNESDPTREERRARVTEMMERAQRHMDVSAKLRNDAGDKLKAEQLSGQRRSPLRRSRRKGWPHGCEMRVMVDGELRWARPYRENAGELRREAEHKRQQLEACGWTPAG